MARKAKTVWEVTDDLTGEALSAEEAAHVRLSYSGRDYELDLSKENMKKLDDFLVPYLRRAEPTNRTKSRFQKSGLEGDVKQRNQKIRAWAAENGFKVAPRGIIKTEVIDAYDKAH